MADLETLQLLDLVGHLYEAAADPAHWSEFAAALERIYPDGRIALFGHESGKPAAQALAVRRNFHDDDLRAYQQHHAKSSPYLARAHRLPVGKPLYSEVTIRDDELMKTEHYNEFVRPRKLGHYATGMIIDRTADRLVALSIADHRDDADRRAHQIRLLTILGPHLMRSYKLYRKLAAEKASADAAQAALDRWAHAALVLTSDARIVSINRAGEALLNRDDGIRLDRDGRLRCVDEVHTRALDTAIRKCAAITTGADAQSPATELDGIALPRSSGAVPLHAMLWPLPFLGGGPPFSDVDQGCVLLALVDPGQAQRTPIGWLARQFGLTPSEQRLTEAIINGLPLAEAAEQLGIRLSTARTRLKTIQTKTDCHRQADLVRLAISLPAINPDQTSR
ncbi:MAG TPA: hypothetical protein VFB45_24840 [Pseudolabrys sp.]|nr:hypothetical protein [Pseudolabrys sp.]